MNDALNNGFRLGIYENDKPIDITTLKQLVYNESPFIQNSFRNNGYISSQQYPFITIANFDCDKNYNSDENVALKDEQQKKMAEENLQFMQNYFQKRIRVFDVNVQFAYRNDRECILYDKNRKLLDINDISSW